MRISSCAPDATSERASATTASIGRLASLPLKEGMEQNAHGALQPSLIFRYALPFCTAGRGIASAKRPLRVAKQRIPAEGDHAAGSRSRPASAARAFALLARSALMNGTTSIQRRVPSRPSMPGTSRTMRPPLRCAMQPAAISTCPRRLDSASSRRLASDSSSAACRKPHVFTIRTSASSGTAVPR